MQSITQLIPRPGLELVRTAQHFLPRDIETAKPSARGASRQAAAGSCTCTRSMQLVKCGAPLSRSVRSVQGLLRSVQQPAADAQRPRRRVSCTMEGTVRLLSALCRACAQSRAQAGSGWSRMHASEQQGT